MRISHLEESLRSFGRLKEHECGDKSPRAWQVVCAGDDGGCVAVEACEGSVVGGVAVVTNKRLDVCGNCAIANCADE